MPEPPCAQLTTKEGNLRVLTVRCESCLVGTSSLTDPTCREGLVKLLRAEPEAERLQLSGVQLRVFQGESLRALAALADFHRNVDALAGTAMPTCGQQACALGLRGTLERLAATARNPVGEPAAGYQRARALQPEARVLASMCKADAERLLRVLREHIEEHPVGELLRGFADPAAFYATRVQPYVRPMFLDSFILLEPPANAVFLKSYEVPRRGNQALRVSLYALSNRPEKLYFVLPPEYQLPPSELRVLMDVRRELASHRPPNADFVSPQHSRSYFLRLGRDLIRDTARTHRVKLEPADVERLADVFARYTAGLGILEDILRDPHVQDVYVNAPVEDNPLHLVVDGEEFTSNVYFAENDVEALTSRFRALSGRPFSEASPVLDMDLSEFHTRVAAIARPLTPKGFAFAFRRHRADPWTLPRLVAGKMVTPLAAGLLSFLVDGQTSILIAGSRGAGKTSLLTALMLEIPQRFRILTIEDTPEVPVEQLQRLGYRLQSLITQSLTSAGSGSEVDPTTALRTALRLGESVLILGEVRGAETKVLYEAMRVGAAGNLIMGTIHGATTRDVFERVVYDIGVPPTSFKATDVVVVAAPIRLGGGVERVRRVVQISEVLKSGWSADPDPDRTFADIMTYDPDKDQLEATTLMDMGQSEVLGRVSRKWGLRIEDALANIRVRGQMKAAIAEAGQARPKLLDAAATRDANNAFWMLLEENRRGRGKPDVEEVHARWQEWWKGYAANG